MVFTGDFQNRRKGFLEPINRIPDLLCNLVYNQLPSSSEEIAQTTYMLIDEDNANVFALFCESVEGRLNEGSLRLRIDD